jgi:hypothetical protein
MLEKDGSNGEQGSARKLSNSKNKCSEEWRNECEARELLNWPLAARRKQLDLVQQKRGWEARLKLQDEMERLWKAAKNQHSNQGTFSTKTERPMQQQKQIDLI